MDREQLIERWHIALEDIAEKDKKIERLKKENEWLFGRCASYSFYTRTVAKEILLAEMQQALKESK